MTIIIVIKFQSNEMSAVVCAIIGSIDDGVRWGVQLGPFKSQPNWTFISGCEGYRREKINLQFVADFWKPSSTFCVARLNWAWNPKPACCMPPNRSSEQLVQRKTLRILWIRNIRSHTAIRMANASEVEAFSNSNCISMCSVDMVFLCENSEHGVRIVAAWKLRGCKREREREDQGKEIKMGNNVCFITCL